MEKLPTNTKKINFYSSTPKEKEITKEEYVLAKKINFYKELGVSKDVSLNQISQAYAQKMNELQSKRGKIRPSSFKQLERRLQIIYKVLGNKRENYDNGLNLGIYQK
jgi:hypothetical protein